MIQIDDLEGKSLDYIVGFLSGVKLFAHWNAGTQYVGTCETTYVEVLKDVNALLDKRKTSKTKD